ncbi:MAG: hypothetical protein ACPLRR_04105 [Candidatus Saccharicenans sp.]
MAEDWTRRQDYYQKIARTFLKHQTSLFFLPPRDLDLISEWEKLNIPLEAIVEGIERAFARKLAGRRKRNIYSLSQCEKEILKAYAQHQERLVGQQAAPSPGRKQKADLVSREISACLAGLPENLGPVRRVLEEALTCLEADSPDEDRLENLDEELDRILWDLAPEEEKQVGLAAIRKDYPGGSDSQLQEILHTAVVKNKRQLFRIPRLALFYY